MQIEMIQGTTYVDMASGTVFKSGQVHQVSDEVGLRLLRTSTPNGIPYFRVAVEGVAPKKVAESSKPSAPEKPVTDTENARAVRRASGAAAGTVKFGGAKAKTGAPAGVIEPPEDGGVTV